MFKEKSKQPSEPEMELTLLPHLCYGRIGWDRNCGRTMLFKDVRDSVIRAVGFLTIFSNKLDFKVGFVPINTDFILEAATETDASDKALQNALSDFEKATDEGFDVVGKITRHGMIKMLSGKASGDLTIGVEKYKIQCEISMAGDFTHLSIIPYGRKGELITNKRVIMENE